MSLPRFVAWIFLLAVWLGVATAAAGSREPQVKLDGDTVVITGEQIRRLSVHALDELLSLIPGVKAAGNHVSIRGSYKVKVLLDGMSLRDPASGGLRLNLVPFQQLRKVVVKKGGGSVAYGDDSSGGVILLYTRRMEKTRYYLEASGGKFNYQNYKANLSYARDAWGLALSGEYYYSDRFRRNYDKERIRGGLKLSYRPPGWQGTPPTLSLDLGRENRGNPGYLKYPTPHSRSRDDSLGVSLAWSEKELASSTSVTRFYSQSLNPDAGFESTLESWNLRQDLRTTLEAPWLGKLNCGVLLNLSQGRGSDFDSRQEQSYGLFAHKTVEFQVLPVSLQLGIRANFYSEYQTVLNPEMRLGWKLGRLNLKASAVKSNNVPSFRQRYFRTRTLIPNPDLGPEEGVSYTLGVSARLLKGLSGDLTLFHREIKDRISYVRGDGGVGQYRNAGRTRTQGMELALAYKPMKWLELRPSYTYLQALNLDTGLWMVGKPRHKVKVDLVLRPWPRFMLGFLYTYSSEIYTRWDNQERADAYQRLDLRSEYRFDAWRIFASVRNLLDEEYFYGDGYPASPLSWIMGVSREF